MFKKIIQLWKN